MTNTSGTRVPDDLYSKIAQQVLTDARLAPKSDWMEYERIKHEHEDDLGMLYGDPRYDSLISSLVDALVL